MDMDRPEPAESLVVVSLESPKQPFLFDDVDAGCELLTIEADRAANKHTGSTLEKRVELFDEICLRLAAGVSMRNVARIYGVGRNTVAAIARKLEEAGKMEPYKKRMAGKLGVAIEMGTDLILEGMEKGLFPLQALPVAVGILSDKKALLDGEPTSILGKQAGAQLSQEEWDRYLANLPSAKAGVIELSADSQSTGKAPDVQ